MDPQSPFRRMAARVAAWNAWVSRPLSTGSSQGLVIAGIVVISVAALIGRSRGAIVAADFGALTLYSLLDPLLVGGRRGSWLALAMRSLAGWMVLFMIGAAASQKMGSDATIFLLPFMLFPATLVLGGLLRLLRRATHRAPPEAQGP